jgi:tetratricopeptide (TPR) repeat protein
VETVRGRHDEARRAYERAAALLPAAGDLRLTAVVASNLGVLLTETGDAERARMHLERAIATAADLGERRLEAVSTGNLAFMLLDQGALAEAMAAFARAVASLHEIGDAHRAASCAVDRGMCLHQQGELVEARRAYVAVLEAMRDGALPSIEALAHVLLGALDAERGQVLGARAAFDEGEAILRRIGDDSGLVTCGALRAILDLAEGKQEDAKARIAEASSHAARSAFVRIALRLVERVRHGVREPLERRAGANAQRTQVLIVDHQGRWFTTEPGRRVELGRRRAARRLLVRLVEQRLAMPHVPLDMDAMVAAGWPGERMRPESGRARVYTEARTLRDLGLGPLLLTSPDGYLLEPSMEVRFAAPERGVSSSR